MEEDSPQVITQDVTDAVMFVFLKDSHSEVLWHLILTVILEKNM